MVTGFEPIDILQGIYLCIQQMEKGEYKLENQYNRSVRQDGNETAKTIIKEVFEIVPREWRGLGEIPQSGLGIKQKYINFDAQKRFNSQQLIPVSSPCQDCISGEILQGIKKPQECPVFGTRCTPEHPLGAPMVSSEGACAAYYRYRQQTKIPVL